MMQTITSTQAQHLAGFVASIRPGWDIPGIAAALHAARYRAPVDELAIALIRLAGRDDLRTPALLAQDGPHWHGLEVATTRAPQQPKCPTHGIAIRIADGKCTSCLGEAKGRDENRTDTLAITPDQAATNARGAANARRAIQAAATTPTTKENRA